MKNWLISIVALSALAACGGGSSTPGSDGGASSDGGTPDGGGAADGGVCRSAGEPTGTVNVTISNVGVHPAAVTALAARGLKAPSYLGYTLVLQGVSIGGSGLSITALGQTTITAANETGPITFPNVDVSNVSIGLISAILSPAALDAGASATTWPTCAELTAGGDAGTVTDGGTVADGGSTSGSAFVDSFVPAGAQVHFGKPTCDITDGAAFALPASYAALLDCAATQPPGKLLAAGFALLYASQSAAGAGTPTSGLTFSGSGGGTVVYYAADYSSASPAGPTLAAGIATDTGVSSLGQVSASNGTSTKFPTRDIATPSGAAYMVFFSPQ